MGGSYFLIFKPKDMLNLCLNLNESQPIYAYKCYACKKECTCISCKCKPFWQFIALAYFAISRNANHFVHEKLTQRLFSTIKCTFTKEENNEKFKDRNFAIVC